MFANSFDICFPNNLWDQWSFVHLKCEWHSFLITIYCHHYYNYNNNNNNIECKTHFLTYELISQRSTIINLILTFCLSLSFPGFFQLSPQFPNFSNHPKTHSVFSFAFSLILLKYSWNFPLFLQKKIALKLRC